MEEIKDSGPQPASPAIRQRNQFILACGTMIGFLLACFGGASESAMNALSPITAMAVGFYFKKD